MRRYLIALLTIVMGAFHPQCRAQTESLLIGPGDLVQVDVIDTPELSQQVRVSDEGTISLAYLGKVKVAGESPSVAASNIQGLLIKSELMRHPEVTLRVMEYATQDVSVLGQVRIPGTYPITTPQSILKMISQAGGLTDLADRHMVVRRHGSSQTENFYLSNDANVALSNNVMVNPGDVILVPRAPVVYVMGDVQRPGGYSIATIDSRLTILQAVAEAGSANKTAAKSHVRLIRNQPSGPVESSVNLDNLERGKEPDVELHDHDILYIPFSYAKNVVIGSASIGATAAGSALYLAR